MSELPMTVAKAKHVQIIPLRDWVGGKGGGGESHLSSASEDLRLSRESIIRKVTVAYGLVELLIRCPTNNVLLDDEAKMGIDNFAVCVSQKIDISSPSQQQQSSSWDDIRGIRMLSSGLSLSMEEPSYLSCLFEEGVEKNKQQMGRYLEVELDAANALVGITKGEKMSKLRCHNLLAKILHQLFTNNNEEAHHHSDDNKPAPKRAKNEQITEGEGEGASISISTAVSQMQELNVPASICRVVQNLFESTSESGGNNAYNTLEEVGKDLHLLLLDPDRFLFDREAESTDKMQLQFRKGKLYGRDEEETLITDTFCRVTRGRSEAFFIGGFSGSGKSMLVDTLRVNVESGGGYVIKHKFDAMSQDMPLYGVIAALNNLCLKIKKTLSPQLLTVLSEKLRNDFGGDISLLARMLPNIHLLSNEYGCGTLSVAAGAEDGYTIDRMNPRSVSFTLLRFVRLVSSPTNPIMVSDF